MKKIMFGLIFFLFARTICHAQNGLENITVEKFYVSNFADSVGSVGTLPVGSVTYRVYADMLPGYTFQALYGTQTPGGVPIHTLLIQSSTTFFNNEDYGAPEPNFSATNARKNSVLLDSWFSAGGATSNRMGVLKSEDTDGSPGNAQGILQNNDPSASGPINIGSTASMLAQDGLIIGTPQAVTFVGISNTGNGDLGVFAGLSQVGGLFSTSNGSVASLNGSTGPTAANRVLIGQFTTEGIFHFELNVQIGTPSGGTENYVALNPGAGEISIPSLIQTFGAANLSPTVSITAPSNGASYVTNTLVGITAVANDPDGTVDSVAFYIDGVFLSKDLVAPYTANYISTPGSHCITARATDNNGAQTTTSCINIVVTSNPPPTLNITAPANLSNAKVNVLLNIAASAMDNTTVDSVAFYYDGAFISKDLNAPYTASYLPTVLGTHTILARATDDQGASSTASITINVVNNTPPSVSLTAPANGAIFTFPAVVTINANANDGDGTVDSVEFLVNGIKVGSDNLAPYTFNWNSVVGPASLSAKATDNNGAVSTSGVRSITIADPNALPYKIVTSSISCNIPSICLPVAANDTIQDVIGYDIVLQFDPAKVMPTGNITVDNDLINPVHVDVIKSIDSLNGVISISVYFNSSAPANANFKGIGNLLCVEFNKTTNFNPSDAAEFSIVSLQESYFNGVVSQLADGGKLITYRDSIFNGTLMNWLDNSPIRYNSADPGAYLITNIYGNNINCNAVAQNAIQPDTLGLFQYDISNSNTITLVKDILGTTDMLPVINGMDAMFCNKVLLNDLSFIPNIFQAIAMDVNMDGVISAGDVSQINQRAVLMIPEFKQAWNYNAQGVSNGQPSYDWKFIDSILLATNPAYVISTTYPLNDGVGFSKSKVPVVPSCIELPVTTLDCPEITPEYFKGILLGDVNGNYATVTPNGLFRNANDKVIFDLSNAVSANGYIDIPVSVQSAALVNAVDFSLKYNEADLAFNTVNAQNNYMQMLAKFNDGDHILRFTSNSNQNYELNKSLVTLRFASIASIITDTDIHSIKGYINGEEVNVEVKGASFASSTIGSVLVNVYPNPANEILNVTASENATVNLMSLDGKNVMIESRIIANQLQPLNTSNISDGIYILKVFNDNFISTQKVVINN